MHRKSLLLWGVVLASAVPAQVSKNCQLLSKRTRAGTSNYSGVWGYVAPDGSEYACVGNGNGTWIVETTDPVNPVERGFIPGPSSSWREVSGYGQYLYTVTEATGGAQIISMANPRSPVLVRTLTRSGWTNTHSVSVDQTAGILYCNGTNGSGVLIFDLKPDPANPTFLTSWNVTYVHDSFIQNGFAYFSCIFDGQLRIMDVSLLPSIVELSRQTTPNSFTHNAWANSTDTIAITSDETGTGYMQAYDVSNKRLPRALGNYRVTNAGIHNVFITDDKVAHMSYYSAGYRGVDLSNPNTPREIGYYDTASAWGCYPFQPSGTIYVSDIPGSGGLYCVRLSCGVPQRYGTGTAGSGGRVPVIGWSGGVAAVGNGNFRVELTNALPSTSAALLIGASRANIPLLGVTLLADPAAPAVFLGTATGASGSASMPVPVPAIPGLGNASVYAQWIVADPGATQGFAASTGSQITICPAVN